MSIDILDDQTFDEWWASLPSLADFSSPEAQKNRDALEAELIEMSQITSLLGKRRKAFKRAIHPNIEMSVDRWGGVVRRIAGYGLGKFSDANASDWLVFASMETLAVFRGETDRSVSHTLKTSAVLSRASMQSMLEQDTAITPDQICKEVTRLFDAIGRETKFDNGGPDAVFDFPPVTLQFAIDESGDARLLNDHRVDNPDVTSFLKIVSPTPTIVPIGNGGLIVEEKSFEPPLSIDPHRELVGTKWVHDNEVTSDMKRVLSAWTERLNNKELWVPGYDPDAMRSLTLELQP